jgi:hypothetical protein
MCHKVPRQVIHGFTGARLRRFRKVGAISCPGLFVCRARGEGRAAACAPSLTTKAPAVNSLGLCLSCASCLASRSCRHGQVGHLCPAYRRGGPTGRLFLANYRVGGRSDPNRAGPDGHPAAPHGDGSSRACRGGGGPNPDEVCRHGTRRRGRHIGYTPGRSLSSRSR